MEFIVGYTLVILKEAQFMDVNFAEISKEKQD